MQRNDIHTITFTVRCESGLHIGGSQDELTIGGSDNPVIKNPVNGRPYIPGSSMKGKMRAELEKQWGRFTSHRGVPQACGCGEVNCPVCRVFGAHMNTQSRLGPSRIIVRDGRLTGSYHLENKVENVISRRTGAAEHPRSNERVVEGAEFDMQIVLQVFEGDSEFSYTPYEGGDPLQGAEALQAVVADGLKLVQMTGLGGGTSRGSGAVSFHYFKLDGGPWTHWSD